MFCSDCGHAIRDDARFCADCGHPNVRSTAAAVDDAATVVARPTDAPLRITHERAVGSGPRHASSTAGSATPRVSIPAWVKQVATEGWGTAALGAAIPLAGVLAVGMLAALPLRLTAGAEWGDASQGMSVSSLAGLIGLGLARFPLVVEGAVDLVHVELAGQANIVGTNVTVLLLYFVLVMAGGRVASRSVPSSDPRVIALQGAKVAIPLALFSVACSRLFEIGGPSGRIAIDAGPAFWWAMLSGGVFALAGAVRSGRRRGAPSLTSWLPEKLRDFSDGLSGAVRAWLYGVTMMVVVFTAVLGIGVFLSLGEDGLDSGGAFVGLVVAYVLMVPNLTLNGLLFAHGSSYEFTWMVNDVIEGPAEYGYLRFPMEDPTYTDPGVAPWFVFLLLLVPLIAAVVGAHRTAVLSASVDRDGARRHAMRMVVPYALLLGATAALTSFTVAGPFNYLTREDFRSDFVSHISGGFSPLGVFVAGLIWGVIGALLASMRFPAVAGAPATPPRSGSGSQASARTAVAGNTPCPSCGTLNPSGNAFCNACGQPTAPSGPSNATDPAAGPPPSGAGEPAPLTPDDRFCTNCGTKNPSDNRFCHACGESIA